MIVKTDTVLQDIKNICSVDFIDWNRFNGKNILVTGATGLIGSTIVNALLYANKERNLNLSVLALVRSIERAETKFADYKDSASLRFVVGSVENIPEIDGNVDFIIHGASQTASKAFVQQPVETIITAVQGTLSLLELAKNKKSEGMVYLSSMEAYGHPNKGHKVVESDAGALSPLDVRNSYPVSKQQCEALCCAYASEYGVPVMIARLTQTFGPGVDYNDNRIFAYFGRCVLEKQDIVLKTKGETERDYLYTADAVTAILTIMLRGEQGTAYNIADESTYCSIAEMAHMLADKAGINVTFDIQDASANGYLSTLYMDLDTTRLRSLGWNVLYSGGLSEIYGRMISCMTK